MAEPLCRFFGKCSGCSLQHIAYAIQLENKKAVLGKSIGFNDIQVFSGEEYNYRNRFEVFFTTSGIGLRKKGHAKATIKIDRCAICENRINGLISEIAGLGLTDTYAIIRSSSKASSIAFILDDSSTRLTESVEKIKEFSKCTSADSVVVTYSDNGNILYEDMFLVKGTGLLVQDCLGKRFFYDALGFFQNNHQMAERMQTYCHKLLEKYDTKNSHLLDLYGGVGTFGITNAGLFCKVTIVESVKKSVELAEKNIRENRITNARAVCLDAAQLKKLDLTGCLFAIVDPPRTGMDERVIRQLNELRPEVIIYISCNPRQLAKEIRKFKGYGIKSAALFDMFPQTNHIEAVVELVCSDTGSS